ncbi:MSHA pilin protein MshD [Gammaproteobacteria bacterium]
MSTEIALKRHREQGLTLIELIMAIIIISISVVGILSVLNVTVKSSADPMLYKQAIAMAEAIMEEVLAKDYTCTPREATRALYDDVCDYDGQTIFGTDTLGTAAVPALAAYTATIVVSDFPIGAIPMKQVIVTVTGSGITVSENGYRSNIGLCSTPHPYRQLADSLSSKRSW